MAGARELSAKLGTPMDSVFDLPLFNERLFFPRPDVTPCPEGAEDLQLEVEPGVTLHARVYPRGASKVTLVLFHGNGEVVSDYDRGAHRFSDAGAQLIAVDFRAYGASTGTPNYRNCISDAPTAVRQLRTRFPERRPWVIFGRSLGGACCAEVAGTVPPLVDAAVFESCGSDLYGLIARRGLTLEGELDAEELAYFDPKPKFARCQLPSLVLHGAADQLIRPAEAEVTLSTLGTSRKRLVLVEGRGHNDVSGSPDYWTALQTFLAALTG